MITQTNFYSRYERGIFTLYKLILPGFLFLFFVGGAFAQREIPCFDPQTEKAVFVKSPQRKSLKNNICRTSRRVAAPPAGVGEFVTLSGHITHQNGVRLSGVTVTITDEETGATRTSVTDATGNYFFGNIPYGSGIELRPMREGYQFFPPAVIWSFLGENTTRNFIAAGPPPEPPAPPANQPTLASSSYYNHAANLSDFNAMLGRDAQGNVYVGGTSYIDEESGDTDIVLTKTDQNGNLVWSKTFNGTGNYKDGIRDLAVDAAGNVYLAGYTYNGTDPATRSYDYVILKFNTNGERLWTKTYGKTVSYDDFPTSMKIDAAGNIVVTGYSWDAGVFADYATLKFDTNGTLLWEKRYSTAEGEAPNEVELDAAGNVYVTGMFSRDGSGGAEDFLTIKYSSTGQQLWTNTFNSPANDDDEGFEIEIDQAGNVYVMGRVYNEDFNQEALIQKINGTSGATLWTQNYVVPNSYDATVPLSMKLDQAGNIVVAGITNLSGEFYEFDVFVAKFDANAAVQWLKTYDGPAQEDYDGDPKILLGGDGSVYLGLTSEGFLNADMQIIKYSASGEQIWTYRFGNPFYDHDAFLDWEADVSQTTMLLDAGGNLYIAGESYIPEQGANLVAFKLEPQAQARAVANDFDGDKKADIAVFRPETGIWYVLKSSDGNFAATQWGLSADKLVPADYDGDGKIDIAVYRSGIWHVQKSSNGGYAANQFGLAGDRPIPSDYDNDGRADLSVFRNGIWYSQNSSDNSFKATQFGTAGDIPVPSDFDSNRRSDIAVFRNGFWYVQYQAELTMNSIQFGIQTDKIIPADYDGDRKTDYAVFRSGNWYIWQSSTNSAKALQWGSQGDIPVPADYDGDKKTDLAVYRQGVWYILRSSNNSYATIQFGLPTDVPLPSAYTN